MKKKKVVAKKAVAKVKVNNDLIPGARSQASAKSAFSDRNP